MEQVNKLEEETRQQSSCKLWFIHRAGRITASIFKSVCSTNPTMFSSSLIKRLCSSVPMTFLQRPPSKFDQHNAKSAHVHFQVGMSA